MAVGGDALRGNVDGIINTVVGASAMRLGITGSHNVALGGKALFNNIGNLNTAVGTSALENLTSGTQSIAIGFRAGENQTTGSQNIYMFNSGVAGESGTIRIGHPVHTSTFIEGIRGVSTGQFDAIDVVIDSLGQLGTVSSSRRYKEDIEDMAGASGRLLQLRPVTFRYKQAAADGSKPQQYGLIAEEVAEVYPDLVVYNADGEVETVQYRKLTTMLLNELQKEHRVNMTQAEKIHTQQEKMLV